MEGLKNKTAIITGAAGLLGMGIVNKFVDAGVRVIAADINIELLTTRLAEKQSKTLAVQLDLADDDSITALVNKVSAEYGALDFLINAATLYPPVEGLARTATREHWREIMDVNVIGFALLTSACLPLLMKDKPGSIINFSSIASLTAVPNMWVYPTSKGAINQLTKSQAVDLAPHKIRVNAIAPAWTWSDPVSALFDGDQQKADEVAGEFHALGRIGRAEEVGDACLFLCSDHATWITGQVLSVDGGFSVLGPTGMRDVKGEMREDKQA
jgi:NAD(P)-dependent dehydrogenase (short-subunit alcohol dehydrogenase family)